VHSHIVPDIVDHRLGVAKELGADCTYLSKANEDEQEAVKTVHSLLAGPPDITIDCSGAEANIRLNILVSTTFQALNCFGILSIVYVLL
jgi:L-iditol 2-dehydrogenase